jgi:Flp pilus assembly protein TadG
MNGASRRKLRGFFRDSKGNVAILFGLALIPLFIGIGAAVDYGRALIVRQRMADAADSAALAIGSWAGLSQSDLKAKAQQFFNANYPPSSLGTAGALDVQFSGDNITVKVSGKVPTTFLKLAHYDAVDVGVSSTVTKNERNIELALVLDTTGSMDQGGKIDALKKAANKMVETLFNGKSTSDSLKIAVVPFAAAVNVGSGNDSASWLDSKAKSAVSYEDFASGVKVLDLAKKLKAKKSSWAWGGCVRERAGSDYELTDATPSSSTSASLFAPYFAPDEPDEDNANDENYSNSYIDDADCGQSKSKNRTPDKCQRYTGKYDNIKTDNSRAEGPNLNCPPNAITPLSNTKSTVTNAINALQPKGNTVIPAGLLWGWRVLSPTEPFTDGKPYDDDHWVKAIVLLTDGENMVSGGSNGHNGSSYNAFGYAANGHLGSTSGSQAESKLDSKTASVCSAIKATGIRVYTIGFQINDSDTQNMLRSCASKTDMYYNSPSNDQLASIFQDIAQGLSELRIAQ